MSQLFGIFATHTPESCPLNNSKNKKIFFQLKEKVKQNLKKYKVTKIVGFYISVLEHQWVIILEGKNAHDIETLCIDSGISAFNTVKIVPLSDLSKAAKKMKN